jgi:hypothetical protein
LDRTDAVDIGFGVCDVRGAGRRLFATVDNDGEDGVREIVRVPFDDDDEVDAARFDVDAEGPEAEACGRAVASPLTEVTDRVEMGDLDTVPFSSCAALDVVAACCRREVLLLEVRTVDANEDGREVEPRPRAATAPCLGGVAVCDETADTRAALRLSTDALIEAGEDCSVAPFVKSRFMGRLASFRPVRDEGVGGADADTNRSSTGISSSVQRSAEIWIQFDRFKGLTVRYLF